MAKKEAQTDLWVAKCLDAYKIPYTPQGCSIKEIDEALKTASKRETGKAGFPDFVAVSKDFVLAIEDKADTRKQICYDNKGVLDMSERAVTGYAVNGACFYAKRIAQGSSFHKVFAVGVSGDEKHHFITPLYVDDRGEYRRLRDLESFASFSEDNIQDYYSREVLKEPTSIEKTTEEILKDASELHEYLRTYGSLKDQDKPLVVAGILLALDEIEKGGFSIDLLTGDQTSGATDGDKIMAAVKNRLTRSNVGPDAKRDKLLLEFSIIKRSYRLSEVDPRLGKTPLKYFTEFLNERIFRSLKRQDSSEDFIGRFYGEFMSYSGGDGQSLGIILTPKHICDLMCDLVDLRPNDVVLDPCCGTAGFLIAAMHRMLQFASSEEQRKDIKKKQLHGFEIQSNMFAIACANMILRNDGNSNLRCCDFFKQNPSEVQLKGATVGLMNPPYSQGSKEHPEEYELSFVERLLDSCIPGARVAVIVPQSSMTGKTTAEKDFKKEILSKNTLEGVLTCNTDTFYGVGTNPAIAIFTAGEPNNSDHKAKFIDFRNDGYEVHQHIGLVETSAARDKKAHLLSVWRGKEKAPSKFCVETPVKPEDEWLHSFYYFNDEIPTDEDFEKSIADYLTFQMDMVAHGRGYLFEEDTHAKSK